MRKQFLGGSDWLRTLGWLWDRLGVDPPDGFFRVLAWIFWIVVALSALLILRDTWRNRRRVRDVEANAKTPPQQSTKQDEK